MLRPFKKDKVKIFVAEDDEDISALLVHILEREGFEVIHAADGKEALSIIRTEAPPEIACLDLMMPFRDGFHLLKEIRQSPTWNQVTVIMLSSKTNEKDIIRALNSGANDYITKPFNPQELTARIKRSLRDKA